MKTSEDGLVIEFEKGEEIVLNRTYEWIDATAYDDFQIGRKRFIRGLKSSKSDLQKFIDLYHSVGIEFGQGINTEEREQHHGYQYIDIVLSVFDYVVPEGTSCYCYRHVVYFDRDGKFIQQGIWE